MPTYEYLCKSCGQRLEVQQAFTDDPLTECPTCEGPLRKVFGNVGISFKGSGFYKTDSRSSSKSDKSDAPKTDVPKSEPSKTDGGSSPSTSTESKAPAAASA